MCIRDRTLRAELESGTLEVAKFRRSATEDEPDSTERDDSAVRRRIRAEFGLPETLSDPDAERTLTQALRRLVDDDGDRAAELLAERFVTPCETTEPAVTDHGDGHGSACIRHRDEHRSIEQVSK